MKKVIVRIERSEDGYYWLNSQGLQNILVGNGATIEEAKADFLSCFEEMKLSYTERGEALPDELVDTEFEFQEAE